MDMMIDAVNVVLPRKMPSRYKTGRMNLGSFVKRLNTVTAPFNVVNEVEPDPTLIVGGSAISAFWYPKNLLPENNSYADVRIIWHPHPAARRIKMSPIIWARRRFYFWERVAHEFVHRYQDFGRAAGATSRTFRVRTSDPARAAEQQQYYSDYDELEAYAHDAALEIITWWPEDTRQQAISLSNITPMDVLCQPSYYNYLEIFEVGHPARANFRRKVKQWYHAMKQTEDFYTKLALPKLASV